MDLLKLFVVLHLFIFLFISIFNSFWLLVFVFELLFVFVIVDVNEIDLLYNLLLLLLISNWFNESLFLKCKNFGIEDDILILFVNEGLFNFISDVIFIWNLISFFMSFIILISENIYIF